MNELAHIAPDDTAQHWIDRRDKPSHARCSRGHIVELGDDTRFDQLFALWKGDACTHPRRALVAWIGANNQRYFRWYCEHCGHPQSQLVKKAEAALHTISDICKDALASRHRAYEGQRQSELDKITQAAADRADEHRSAAYDDYLRSPEWKRRAAKIMQRAAGTCEGCLSRPATCVHHLTYDHIYREFAFELVALCNPCHTRVHFGEKS